MIDGATTVVATSTRIVQVVEASRRLPQQSATEIRPSPIQGVFPEPVLKKPAQMMYAPKSELDTLSVMMSKYASPVLSQPEGYKAAMHVVVEKLGKSVGFSDFKTLNSTEAIQGIDGMDAIDLNTSPGIPYVFANLRKRDMILDGNIISEYLNGMIKNHLDDMIYGRACNVTFMTCAKDELRDCDKVDAGKTRAIECAPVCFTIACRMLLGPVVAKLQSNPGWDTGIAVGVDPDTDWTWIYKEALSFGDKALSLDYRNFDGCVQPFMIECALEIVGVLGSIPEPIIRSLRLTLVRSRRQVGSMVYYVEGT